MPPLPDLDALAVAPRWLNVKPSRFGTLARLFDCIEACEARGISLSAGGSGLPRVSSVLFLGVAVNAK